MQLVAHGAQDVYLTGDPQITYFKVVYRRHTNFSMECIQQQFNTTPEPWKKTSCIISRNGDLIGAMWLEFKLATGNNNNLGFASYINQVSIEIGGQKIDTHYGRWLDIWDDLTTDANKDEAMLTMLGNTSSQYTLKQGDAAETATANLTMSTAKDGNVIKIRGITSHPGDVEVTSDYYNGDSIVTISPATNPAGETITVTRTASNMFNLSVDVGVLGLGNDTDYTITIIDDADKVNGTAPTTSTIDNTKMGDCFALLPLSFWFNRNVGLALPLIALQYHEIKLNIDFADTTVWTPTTGCRLWIDYIFLDSEERKRFAQMSHEYLIDQVQSETISLNNASSGGTQRLEINFNHPIKELVWVAEDNEGVRQVDITNVKLKLNGHDRFYPRCGEYFRLQQPYQFHSTVPPAEDIYVYSFALRPEEHQPSGTCNFSRIDSCQMTITRYGRKTDGTSQANLLSKNVYMYGINYNVLRIASGMAGLAYSN